MTAAQKHYLEILAHRYGKTLPRSFVTEGTAAMNRKEAGEWVDATKRRQPEAYMPPPGPPPGGA